MSVLKDFNNGMLHSVLAGVWPFPRLILKNRHNFLETGYTFTSRQKVQEALPAWPYNELFLEHKLDTLSPPDKRFRKHYQLGLTMSYS
jgi:hypothetical protein